MPENQPVNPENDAAPTVLDLDDPYFDGQTLPDALRDYAHVHSTTGVCVKAPGGRFCTRVLPPGSGNQDVPPTAESASSPNGVIPPEET